MLFFVSAWIRSRWIYCNYCLILPLQSVIGVPSVFQRGTCPCWLSDGSATCRANYTPWYLDPWLGDAGIISCNGVLVLEAMGSIFDLKVRQSISQCGYRNFLNILRPFVCRSLIKPRVSCKFFFQILMVGFTEKMTEGIRWNNKKWIGTGRVQNIPK